MADVSRPLRNNENPLPTDATASPAVLDIKKKGPWILLATILGSSLVFIDSSVVNVALPRIQTELNATAASVQWVVEAYALFLAALILVGGSLGDRYGRKRIFLIGTVIFALASIWCGISSDIAQLIAARAIQGVGGALLTPGSLAIIRALFPPLQRGPAIGLWSGFSAITSALGPLLGGFLVQHASWRWVFFINIPLAIVVLIVMFWHVPENRSEGMDVHLDWMGALLTTFGLGAIIYGLIESNNLGLGHPLVLSAEGSGIIALLAFIIVETRSRAPMMPLKLFSSRTFAGANLLTLFLYAGLMGTIYFLPFNLILVQGYTPTEAGAAFIPFTLLLFSLSRWAGGLVARYGSKGPLVIGPLIVCLGFILFSRPDIGGTYWTTFFPAIVALGTGMAITITPLTTTFLGAIEDRYAGIASGINNAVARVAGLLSIAVLNIFVLAAFNWNLNQHLDALHITPTIRHLLDGQRAKLAGAEIPSSIPGVLHTTLQRAVAESFIGGFRLAMLIGAGLALTSALCAFFLIEGKKQ